MSASPVTALVAALAMAAGAASQPSAPAPVPVHATAQTPVAHADKAGGEADADDPAIWVHPDRPELSLVIGTLKKGGLEVYGLDGRRLQHLPAPAAPTPGAAVGRFNNVDVIHGFRLGGKKTDLALVSDRGRDRIRAYAIDPAAVAAGRPPLRDVTASDVAPVFAADEQQVNEQRTSYGLTAYRDGGKSYVVVSRRNETRVGLLELKEQEGRVGYRTVDTIDLPHTFVLPDGTRWTPCEDPGERPQVEGMAVDREKRVLYAGQEDVGLWRVRVDGGKFGKPKLIDRVREYGVPWTYDEEEECVLHTDQDPGFGGRSLSADAEGVTIYQAGKGAGYVIVSSQGDDTFAVYRRTGGNEYVGSFAITDGPVTDGVRHSDGATVVNVPLGRDFPMGLLVTHDGEATAEPGRDAAATNFKFTPWEAVATAFPVPLTIDTGSFNPRDAR
ncbi:phytase [Streptomyces calidiresistens]|uniref:Phytase n=1 Tax=Streptomyces calidiresistens TaxID=1485586 RepID=A0A7W3XWS8_9ACTN|nr:phytase [Streptomyces calidiresistens]MBB0230153.1 phytase [Streptomyces calidiresistens]